MFFWNLLLVAVVFSYLWPLSIGDAQWKLEMGVGREVHIKDLTYFQKIVYNKFFIVIFYILSLLLYWFELKNNKK